MALLPTPLSSPSRAADERREPGAERRRAQVDVRSSLKSLPTGTITVAPTPARAQRRARRSAAVAPSGSLSRAMTRRATPGGGANAPRLPAESAAAAVNSGTAATTDSTVSIPSPTSSVAPSAGWPNLTAKPWMRPSALRGVATPALAGRRGSSQVRCTPRTALSLPVTAATSAGNRRTLLPSR